MQHAQPSQDASSGQGGATAIDPVCGMTVNIAAAGPDETEVWQGRPFYFCCSGGRDTFRTDPEKYASGGGAKPFMPMSHGPATAGVVKVDASSIPRRVKNEAAPSGHIHAGHEHGQVAGAAAPAVAPTGGSGLP